MIPGSPEWQAKVALILAREASQPLTWWYLSFADTDGWRGGCVVRARGMASAIRRTHELGINPGGEVRAVELLPGEKGRIPHDKLLTKEELGDNPVRM